MPVVIITRMFLLFVLHLFYYFVCFTFYFVSSVFCIVLCIVSSHVYSRFFSICKFTD